jgi:hypothetical protein
MLKTNSFLSANEQRSGPQNGNNKPLRVLEPEAAIRPAKNTAATEKDVI